MSTFVSRAPLHVQAVTLRAIYALPEPLRRLIAGRPIRKDGNELALDAQVLLWMVNLTGTSLTGGSPEESRRTMADSSGVVSGSVIQPVGTRDLEIPSDGAAIPARLYTPKGLAEGSPLLVYYHGGGFVIGSVDSHDNLCRYLAKQAMVRVLSVDYRLAPEHPFPAAPEDALTAFRYAAGNAEALGADPGAIAVGGDSAGANLAAVTCYQAVRSRGPRPVFQLLFYPSTDPSTRYRSQELFAEGFFLTQQDVDWFHDHYCPDPAMFRDPRFAILLADDLRGMPPAYLATAGFDPLRDEGEAFARRLRDAGVAVVARRHDDLIHGYVNFMGVGKRFREAVAEAAGALRTALALRPPANLGDLFGPTEKSTGSSKEKMR
jgi:acetyl esterase